MPHRLFRKSTGSFVVAPIDWEDRIVGDNVTTLGHRLYHVLRLMVALCVTSTTWRSFKNRLVMLSGDNVICSRPGDYYNFFYSSALQQVDSDPIDIAVGSTGTSANATLSDAIEIAEGLLVLSSNEQHVLTTDSEVFGPRTARFNRVGTYRFSGPETKVITRSDGSRERVFRGASAFSLH